MGMANKPPNPSYKRTFHVVSHASNERYRERFPSGTTGHLDEEHLGNWIDRAVVDARRQKQQVVIIDSHDGAPGEVVPLMDGSGLWAVLKPNNNLGMSKRFPFAIVTVLHEHQVIRSLDSGRWLRKNARPSTSQSFTLAENNLQTLEAMRSSLPVVREAEGEKTVTMIKLEFTATDGSTQWQNCETIQEAERLINEPPSGLSYVRAWVPAPTQEVKRTKLILE